MRCTLASVPFSTSRDEGPSEMKQIGSVDIATSKALIGSQIFCRSVRAAHGENHATAKLSGLFEKTVKALFPADATPVWCDGKKYL